MEVIESGDYQARAEILRPDSGERFRRDSGYTAIIDEKVSILKHSEASRLLRPYEISLKRIHRKASFMILPYTGDAYHRH